MISVTLEGKLVVIVWKLKKKKKSYKNKSIMMVFLLTESCTQTNIK